MEVEGWGGLEEVEEEGRREVGEVAEELPMLLLVDAAVQGEKEEERGVGGGLSAKMEVEMKDTAVEEAVDKVKKKKEMKKMAEEMKEKEEEEGDVEAQQAHGMKKETESVLQVLRCCVYTCVHVMCVHVCIMCTHMCTCKRII